ncbi:hypothetical protein FACS189419_00540 [Planctomycetales bacterium]|nr:hypothetical protein FACS189419_00540 [Planctomycetales bacterium]
MRDCFKNFNEGKTWENQLLLDRSIFVPCSPVQMEMEQKHIDEIIRHFPLVTNIVAVDADFVRQQYSKDMAVLKTVWIKRVCDAPIAYLKFKARFFLKLCRDNYLYFGRFNAIMLFPLCFMILLYSFSKRLLNPNLFPCVMLMWSGCLYLAPLFLFLPADIIRYLYWFFAASFISIALFCANSPLFAEITQTVQRYWKRKIDGES